MRLFGLILLIGCAATPKPLPPTVPPANRIELEPLPPDPETEALEGNMPPEEWVDALEAGSCLDSTGKPAAGAPKPCPDKSGIALSEAKAARMGLFKLRYRELRTSYASDKKVFAAHRELYEARLVLADRAIQGLQPSWWDKHKAELGVLGGFLLGAAVTTSVVIVAD